MAVVMLLVAVVAVVVPMPPLQPALLLQQHLSTMQHRGGQARGRGGDTQKPKNCPQERVHAHRNCSINSELARVELANRTHCDARALGMGVAGFRCVSCHITLFSQHLHATCMLKSQCKHEHYRWAWVPSCLSSAVLSSPYLSAR